MASRLSRATTTPRRMTRWTDLKAKADALRALHVPGQPLLLLNAWDAASAVADRPRRRAGRSRRRAPAPRTRSATPTGRSSAASRDADDGGPDCPSRRRSRSRPTWKPATAIPPRMRPRPPAACSARARSGSTSRTPPTRATSRCSRSSGSSAKIEPIAAVRAERGCRSSSTRAPTSSSPRSAIPRRGSSAPSRGRAYLAAGADCIFVPAVADPRRSAPSSRGSAGRSASSPAPARPALAELAALGVARSASARARTRAALAFAQRMAEAPTAPARLTHDDRGPDLRFAASAVRMFDGR